MSLSNFENYLKLNVDSYNSQKNYLSRVKCFFDKHKEFNQENINEYLAKKLDDISESTFNGIVTSLRHYATMNGVEFVLPKYKKVGKKERDYLTEDEMKNELLSYFNIIFERKADFFKFVVQFLFYTGVRPSEMCDLKTVDIDFKSNMFICRDPKNDRDKKVPFPNCLKSSMQKYLQEDKEKAFKIKYANMYGIFKTVNRVLQYKKKLSPHLLRHSYAHYLLDNGVPVEKLQILLGHADLKTTMIYAKPREQDALQSYFDNIKPRMKK